MRVVYNLLLLLAWPIAWVRLFNRAKSEPAYAERRSERWGHVPENLGRDVIWFHTVSAGEAIGAAPTIRALKARMPDQRFLVTTTTPTGSEQVVERLGDIVDHCYAPYDFPWAVARFLRRVEPRALVLMETELWPNILRHTKQRGALTCLVNARLSERSARGYARVSGLTRAMLRDVDHLFCQYPETARRFEALGADKARLEVTGSIKFDLDIPSNLDSEVARLRREWTPDRPAWIAGSTHPGEEEVVLSAHAQLRDRFPNLLLVLVPRHPRRANDVAALCTQRGLSTARLSESPSARQKPDVLIVDVMGQLLYWYGVARVALLGGSLVPVGGHNPIEAAIHGTPMLMARHRFNFAEITEQFEEAGCLGLVEEKSLAGAVAELLAHPEIGGAQSRAAREVIDRNRGAGDKLLARLEEIIPYQV
ncbi:MAG: lipid IV(A) 3-deoxy-D-manno-octulosonic acid transferase [Gammaproteobacteria bacterium]|nr:lipid IV(A) 3-deoxy-D-manno-octulosonic acid transferase [Gammaproteobacteria bacterium]